MTDSDFRNVVLVVMDTARAENFSCYGDVKNTTPFLDDLAEDNVLYKKCFSQANWTLPSHPAMFTGKYTFQHGIDEPKSCKDLQTVMNDLSSLGYENICFSNNPWISDSYGYDEHFDYLELIDGHDLYSELSIGADELNEKYDSELLKYIGFVKHCLVEKEVFSLLKGFKYVLKDKMFLKDSGANETNNKIKGYFEKRENSEPFFLFVNYIEPHHAYRPPIPFNIRFHDKISDLIRIPTVSKTDLEVFLDKDKEPQDNIFRINENLYNGELSYLDSKLRQLYDFLSDKHEDTVFIFTSDHGEYFYEHKLVKHESGLNDEVTHVPLIEVFPEDKSDVVEGPVELRSLKQHILDLAKGENSLINSDGRAFSEQYSLSKELDKFGISSERIDELSKYQVSVTDGEHRLVWKEDGVKQLFKNGKKVENDIKVEELSREIKERVRNPEKAKTEEKQMNASDKEIKKRLEDLGYM